MRLVREAWGRRCPSDDGIRFVRVHGVTRSDGSFGDGWEVQVQRPLSQEVLRCVVRTLAQGQSWARQHWQPGELWPLVSDLPANHPAHQLFRQAVLGDHVAFFAMLDAVEEAGFVTVHRAFLTHYAREE